MKQMKIKTENLSMHTKVHALNFFNHIFDNPGTAILEIPSKWFLMILHNAAKQAALSNDEIMIGYFCRLAIYDFSDPTHKDYNSERTEYYINKTR